MQNLKVIKRLVASVSVAAFASVIYAGSTLAKDSDFADIIQNDPMSLAPNESNLESLREPVVFEDENEYNDNVIQVSCVISTVYGTSRCNW